MSGSGWLVSFKQNLATGLLHQLDELPRHIGIVMDGNRRYAQLHGADRKSGHTSGFETMNRILAMAYSVGIPEISVYAFSIENFRRSPEEVADLMDIARTRLLELVANSGVAKEYGVKIRVVGALDLLPSDIQALAAQIMEETKNNTGAALNLCMPYTAREDIAHGMVGAAHGTTSAVTGRGRGNESIAADAISAHMRTADSLPLDLLIRTSDTYRLSDFLLWEITDDTYIDFVPELWPDYTPMQFLMTIMRWRIRRKRT